MRAVQACDLCGFTEYETVAKRDRRGHALETVVCQTCGLVSHARIPDAEELNRYYATRYRQDYHGEYLPSPHRVVRAWQQGRKLLELLQHEIPSQAKVLEIGSGIGCNLMNFALAGFRATGIEPGEGFGEYSRRHLHADVRSLQLTEMPLTGDADLVLLSHVLEHLPSPSDALARIARLLSPSGKLYVEVPNFARPHAAPGKQFHFAHIYNFTPATLRMLAAKAGFRIVHAYTAPWDQNIAFLLQQSSDVHFRIEGTSYTQTMQAIRRFTRASYYLRLNYLTERSLIMAKLYSDRWFARRRAAAIVKQCDDWHAQQQQQPARLRVA